MSDDIELSWKQWYQQFMCSYHVLINTQQASTLKKKSSVVNCSPHEERNQLATSKRNGNFELARNRASYICFAVPNISTS